MFYYQCKRCNYIAKQKIDIKRHLDKQKKCIIINDCNKTNYELYEESLVKHTINKDINIIINDKDAIISESPIKLKELQPGAGDSSWNLETHVDGVPKKTADKDLCICKKCNKNFSNKSNLNKHFKNNTCKNDNIIQQINNIQNIGVQNIINININSLKGFDEEWNISNITKDMKEKILLSDRKFTNTLENILKNDENLNVILKDKVTGLVYKIKNNKYEAMPLKNIFEDAMDKIYKHLYDFFAEIVNNNKNDIRIDILQNEIKEVDKKYNNYKQSVITSNNVNNCLSSIFDDKKDESIKQYINTNNSENEILESLNY